MTPKPDRFFPVFFWWLPFVCSYFFDEISLPIVNITTFFEISIKYWHLLWKYRYRQNIDKIFLKITIKIPLRKLLISISIWTFLKMSISISLREFCKILISIKYCIDKNLAYRTGLCVCDHDHYLDLHANLNQYDKCYKTISNYAKRLRHLNYSLEKRSVEIEAEILSQPAQQNYVLAKLFLPDAEGTTWQNLWPKDGLGSWASATAIHLEKWISHAPPYSIFNLTPCQGCVAFCTLCVLFGHCLGEQKWVFYLMTTLSQKSILNTTFRYQTHIKTQTDFQFYTHRLLAEFFVTRRNFVF